MANKCDLHENRVITEAEGREYAAAHDATYFETSALNGRGIDLGMKQIAEDLVDYHLSLEKQTTGRSVVYEDEPNDTQDKKGNRFCCTVS